MTVETGALSLADVRAAAERIAPYILKTPTLSGESLAGPGVWLKAENLQRTGSFKVRGAVNAVLQLTPEQRRRGVITLSAGNHGQALAYAAQAFQIPCVVGIAVAIKAHRPKLRIIGVEPEGAPVVSESLAAGHPVAPSRLDSIADGLGAPYTRPFNLNLIQRHVDQMRTVTDEAIIEAFKALAQQTKLVVEPAGAAAVAALLADTEIERPVAAVLSGGNVDMDRLASWL